MLALGVLTRFTPGAGDGAKAGPLWVVARRGHHLLLIPPAVSPSGCTLRAHPRVLAFLSLFVCWWSLGGVNALFLLPRLKC